MDRFLESITVTLSYASSSSAAILITLIDVDISLDMEKHIISLPSSIYGRITFIAVSIDGAEVFGVVLFLSAHSYNA